MHFDKSLLIVFIHHSLKFNGKRFTIVTIDAINIVTYKYTHINVGYIVRGQENKKINIQSYLIPSPHTKTI